MRLFVVGACCLLATASVCKAEFTYQGISRSVFGLFDNNNDRFIGQAAVGPAVGQQDSFITPSVAWVYSSVKNQFLPDLNSRCQFYVSVTQPTDVLLMLTGNSNAVDAAQTGILPSVPFNWQITNMQPYSYQVLHLDPAGGTYRFSAVNGPSAWSFTSLTIADLSAPQSMLRGDMDRNGLLDAGDPYAMILALSDIPAYESAWRLSPADFLSLADVDKSGSVNTADLPALLGQLTAPTVVPEPSAILLAVLGFSMVIFAWMRSAPAAVLAPIGRLPSADHVRESTARGDHTPMTRRI